MASTVSKCINESTYADAFKKAEKRPFYKIDGRTEKSNYTPISILSNVPKHLWKMLIWSNLFLFWSNIIYAVFIKALTHNRSF